MFSTPPSITIICLTIFVSQNLCAYDGFSFSFLIHFCPAKSTHRYFFLSQSGSLYIWYVNIRCAQLVALRFKILTLFARDSSPCVDMKLLVAFLLVVFASHYTTLSGGMHLVQPFNDSVIPKPMINRIRSVNVTAPVSSVLRGNETAQKMILPAFNLFDELYRLTESRRIRNDYLACNVSPTESWSRLAENRMIAFQQGILNRSCFSEIDFKAAVDNGALEPSVVTNIQNVMIQSRKALFDAFSRMPLPANGNWSDANAPYELEGATQRYNDQICTEEGLVALRVNGHWYIQARMTNRPLDLYMSDFHRQTLIEWVPRTFDHSLHMIQKRLLDEKLENSTTVVSMWGGYGSSISEEKFERANGPIAEAFRENVVQVDLASDSVTLSNIAILALPMVMSLIPVAFVADFNLAGIFLYVLFTDIISTVPFIIKGAELIRSAKPQRPVVIGWYGGNDTLGHIQLWYVQCNGHDGFRQTGIVFIVVGCAILVCGLIIEVWAWGFMRQRIFESGDFEGHVDGPFGRVVMDKTTNGLFGATESALQTEYARQAENFEESIARQLQNKSSRHVIRSFGSIWRRRVMN